MWLLLRSPADLKRQRDLPSRRLISRTFRSRAHELVGEESDLGRSCSRNRDSRRCVFSSGCGSLVQEICSSRWVNLSWRLADRRRPVWAGLASAREAFVRACSQADEAAAGLRLKVLGAVSMQSRNGLGDRIRSEESERSAVYGRRNVGLPVYRLRVREIGGRGGGGWDASCHI